VPGRHHEPQGLPEERHDLEAGLVHGQGRENQVVLARDQITLEQTWRTLAQVELEPGVTLVDRRQDRGQQIRAEGRGNTQPIGACRSVADAPGVVE
jgi:hypothetical protein